MRDGFGQEVPGWITAQLKETAAMDPNSSEWVLRGEVQERIFLGRKTKWSGSTARIALPVLGEGELDGGKGVPDFEGADFVLADSVKSFTLST